MKYLLYRDGRTTIGNTIGQIVAPLVDLDRTQRCVVIDGEPDTVSFSDEYTATELHREMCGRALTLLQRRGWTLFEARL
jgi:hypothetical protein